MKSTPLNYSDLWAHLNPGVPSPVRQPQIDAAQSRADREHAGWSAQALAFLLAHAARCGAEGFTGESLLASSAGVVPEPSSGKAWGGVVQGAARRGLIVDTGRTAKRYNGCLTAVWRIA